MGPTPAKFGLERHEGKAVAGRSETSSARHGRNCGPRQVVGSPTA